MPNCKVMISQFLASMALASSLAVLAGNSSTSTAGHLVYTHQDEGSQSEDPDEERGQFEGHLLGRSCSFSEIYPTHVTTESGERVENNLHYWPPGERGKEWLLGILDQAGVEHNSIKLSVGSVDNALATVIGERRYIFYNQAWIEKAIDKSNKDWAAIGLIAHEVGHHLNGHLLVETDDTQKRHQFELEADRYSGSVLFKMGATVVNAISAVETYGSKVPTKTHPAKVARVGSVTDGWNSAKKKASGQIVKATFGASSTSGVAPLEVQFTDHTQGTVNSWNWDFGDGGSSTEQNPRHLYATPGTYEVRLEAEGPLGADAEIRPAFIRVYGSVKVSLDALPRNGQAPLRVAFRDTSTGEITERHWEFGDGSDSSEINPVHTYTQPGSYEVRLEINGPAGRDVGRVLIQVESAVESTPVKPEPKDPKAVVSVSMYHNLPWFPAGLAMGVGLNGSLKNAQGKTCQVTAYFEYIHPNSGQRLPLYANPMEFTYRDENGLVVTESVPFEVLSDNIDLSNRDKTPQLRMSMPYYALNLVKPTPFMFTYTIYTRVKVAIDGKTICTSEWISWPYTL